MVHDHRLERRLVGGATESIFPSAEDWILSEGDHYHALEFVARRKNMDRYISVMDFLFAEIFVEYRSACFRHYKDKGPPAREILAFEQITKFDHILLGALQIAYKAFCEQRKMTWISFRQEALKLAA